MSEWLESVLGGFGSRMESLLILAPLLRLDQKQKYERYRLSSLGFAILLFILEHMLRATPNCTYGAIAQFLTDVVHRQYGDALDEDEALALTRFIVDELRHEGKPFELAYDDLERGGPGLARFALITYADYEIRTNAVRLKLTTEGIDLLFKTREIYQELQISITQLYLRQQIIKGVFDGALRTVQELRLQVLALRDDIVKLKDRIRTDSGRVAKEQEYRRLVERINRQLDREKDVFTELEQLLQAAIDGLTGRRPTARDERALEQIAVIRRELQRVIIEHDRLFTDKLDVGHLLIASLESAIVNAFTTRLNFEREVLRPFLGLAGGGVAGADPKLLKTLIAPILPLRRRPSFNPWRVFGRTAGLPVTAKRQASIPMQVDTEAQLVAAALIEQARRRQREQDYRAYLHLLLEPLCDQDEHLLSQALSDLQHHHPARHDALVGSLDFYPFLVHLHQLGRVPLLTSAELGVAVLDDLPRLLTALCDERPEIRAISAFEVQATKGILTLSNGYVMSDFRLVRHANDL
ncbi:MAG: hypothetical protein H7338_14125 [Candidatus Sericytochromatia bacterium]|nr:hypothetical protein [Candidatus Sericytochromatia bacterium]